MPQAPHETGPATAFCGDDALGYMRSRTRVAPGAGLIMDEAYRLAHLPLVAPGHPRIIATREGSPYRLGRHPRVFSLVLPIPGDALLQAPAYRDLERDLRGAPFAHKIAWSLLPQRRSRLHATICGNLAIGEKPTIAPVIRDALRRLGPLRIELRGLFSGTMNLGRLYLRVHPECRGGVNMVQRIQRSCGRSETDIYLLGLFNLVDDLDAPESDYLMRLIDRWWDRPLLRLNLDHLWLLGATDDLVLDEPVIERVPLTGGM